MGNGFVASSGFDGLVVVGEGHFVHAHINHSHTHLLNIIRLFFADYILGFLVILAVRTQRLHKIWKVKLEINIPIILPNPILNILFFEICAEIEISHEDSQVIRIYRAMCKLVNMSEYL
jgi:hypothetical protein